jgi:protein-tyrosine phosphatase
MKKIPFAGTYWINTGFLAGPSYVQGGDTEIENNIESLAGCGITAFISLVPKEQLLWGPPQNSETIFEQETACFKRHYFPLADGQTPRRERVREILDAIDRELKQGHAIYVHCLAGRGRIGLAAGCWLARHRKGDHPPALDQLSALRARYDLFSLSPETDDQRDLVASWKRDE